MTMTMANPGNPGLLLPLFATAAVAVALFLLLICATIPFAVAATADGDDDPSYCRVLGKVLSE